jgi:hypothetical protein
VLTVNFQQPPKKCENFFNVRMLFGNVQSNTSQKAIKKFVVFFFNFFYNENVLEAHTRRLATHSLKPGFLKKKISVLKEAR